MGGLDSIEEIAGKAFALAFFILGDRAEALAVAREALAKLEVAAAAQFKRLYYTPTRPTLWRRAKPPAGRTKVSLSDLHLLQRLVYVESEPFERARELGGARAEELLVHFVKHLIRISIKRNSFYVALGVSRLLHNYTTSETMEIYNVVVQDPERVKDDYYYRSRKGRLVQEVRERFGEQVGTCRGSRGEERFQTLDSAEEFVGLVAEALTHFSPWQTPCRIPAPYDPTADEIPALSSAHEGEEDKVEINRIHAVVHPDCYERLTASLRLEPPARRLSVPRFNLPNGNNKMSGPNDKSRRSAPPLGAEELEALGRVLSEQSARRKSARASLLSIVVDKSERARFDPERSGSVSFAVSDADELVEVRALDDGGAGTLLATHLLGGLGAGDAACDARFEVVLEGGQKLTFELSPERAARDGAGRGERDEEGRALMTVSYGETRWTRAAALGWRRALRKIAAAEGLRSRPARALAAPAFAAVMLLVCAGALALYFLKASPGAGPAQVAEVRERPPADAAGARPPTNAAADAHAEGEAVPQEVGKVKIPPRRANATPRGENAAQQSANVMARSDNVMARSFNGAAGAARSNTPAPQDARPASVSSPAGVDAGGASVNKAAGVDAGDATRSVGSAAGVTALSKVRKVFVDVTGERELGEQTARLLAERLRAGQRLLSTDDRDEADAALKIKVSRKVAAASGKAARKRDPRPALVTASARLVNEDGEVIWPPDGRAGAGAYTGTVGDVANRIAADLLRDVLKSDTRK